MMKVQLYLLLALVVCDIIFSVIADGALEGRENRQERLDSIHQSPDRSKLESDGDIYADEEDYYSELISEEVFNEIREELMQEDSEFEPDQQQTETTPNEQQERQQESPNTKQNPQQRTSSGKNNIKAGSKLRNALPKKGEGHATASRKSMRAQESKGGSYYGGGAFFHSKKSPPNGSTQESEEKVTGAGKHKQTIESLFSDELRSRIAESEKIKQEQRSLQHYLQICYATARKYARPIELILKAYNTLDGYVDLYKVLGVSRDIGMFDLKKKYRTLALQVHPDKNPHPDAKEAFDAIQDAYVVLSSASKRKEHDMLLEKRARAKAWSLKKVRRAWGDSWYNTKSRALVTLHRCRTGKLREEWAELISVWKDAVAGVKQGILHFILLPSVYDRLLRVNEVWMDYKLYWISIVVALGSMLLS